MRVKSDTYLSNDPDMDVRRTSKRSACGYLCNASTRGINDLDQIAPIPDHRGSRNGSRKLLIVIESAGRHGRIESYGLSVGDPEVQYHLRLMVDAHLLQCVGVADDGAIAVRLTWQGHEMLELARNEQIWERAKSFVQRRTQGLSAAVLQNILSKWATSCAADAESIRYLEHRSHSRPLPKPRASVGKTEPARASGNGNGNGHRTFEPPRAPAFQHEPPSYTTQVSEPVYREFAAETESADSDWRLRADPWYGKYLDGMPIYLL